MAIEGEPKESVAGITPEQVEVASIDSRAERRCDLDTCSLRLVALSINDMITQLGLSLAASGASHKRCKSRRLHQRWGFGAVSHVSTFWR